MFLSWLTECMQRMEGGELTPDEELTCTKLMEYTVQLINNVSGVAKFIVRVRVVCILN